MTRWPYLYYPTTAVFVDDHKGFLNALKHRLPSNLSMNLFNNPIDALNAIQNNKVTPWQNLESLLSIDDQLADNDSELIQQTYIGLHWEELCKKIYNLKRFSTQSVVIVDQMMPELDGISFCKKLKDHPIKKIMLTANSDHSIAVEAFNEGLIDYFILKDSPNLVTQLSQKIETMQKSYFESQTEYALGNLMNTVSLINDPSAIVFYQKIKEELQATEFYILDRWGSVLFLNREGMPTTLVVCPAKVLDAFSQIAEDQDENKTSQSLLRKEKLVFFPRQADYMRPAIEWDMFLHSAKQFPGKSDLFYSLISEPEQQPVQIKNIQSYQSYLTEN